LKVFGAELKPPSRLSRRLAAWTSGTGLVLFAWLGAGVLTVGAAARPNIVLVLADDLGWADVGVNGGDLVQTPHIDRLAREGLRFTQAYAPAPVCSPTRAALLTGKAPARLHITTWAEGSLQGPIDRRLLQGRSLHDLPHTETTLAKHLQAAGYLTALVGKWHLGEANHFPETHGFDINIGGTHWGAPATHFWPYRGAASFRSEYRYVPHLEFGQPGEYLTDRLTDEAISVIDRAGRRPFFLYLAHHAPHTPIEAKPADVEYFRKRLRPGMRHQNPVYAAMVKSLDESVGRVLAHLRKHRLDQNTIVIVTSDNGGYIGVHRQTGPGLPVTDNFPLRSGKASCYEGGLRVPLIVKCPGVTPAGAECHQPVVLTDLFPTLLAAARVALQTNAVMDGVELSALLKDPAAKLDRDALFFHFPHYYHAPPTTPVSAMRAGDWKLLEYFEDGHLELYNLRDDPGEQTQVAERLPAKAAELRQRLETWRRSVQAALPQPNPAYQPSPASAR
jgi:arylsulfatase A-like enzyme